MSEPSIESTEESVPHREEPIQEVVHHSEEVSKLDAISTEIARLHEKLTELTTSLTAAAEQKPLEESAHIADEATTDDEIPDAVNLTIDDKESKASHKQKEEPAKHKRKRGFKR